MADVLLEVNGLETRFATKEGATLAVDRISFTVAKGETLAIVGESGCGKSVTSLSIMGLISAPGRVTGGQIRLEGRDLLTLSGKEKRDLRGKDMAMIFQEPMTSLNPVLRIGNQLAEPLRRHLGYGKKQARLRSVELLELVGIPHPDKVVDYFPHQLSGGMRQRVMIAMALSCHPKLLIADEPTTALDVTIQAQILDLLGKLSRSLQMSVLLITHDLGVVAEMAHRVVVMYAGEVVEEADVHDLFAHPAHPYTIGLLQALPKLDAQQEELYSIPGTVPHPLHRPAGCPFQPRCQWADAVCGAAKPELREFPGGHKVRCFHAAPDGGERS